MSFRGLSGQSAVEYLMTYGWMLLVVAVVGGAIFATVGDQSVESTTGFEGDVRLDNFGVSDQDELGLEVRDGSGQGITVSKVNVSDPDTGQWIYKEFTGENGVGVGSSKIFELPNVTRADSGNELEVEVIYDSEGLSNLSEEGTINGQIELNNTGSFEGLPEDDHQKLDGGGSSIQLIDGFEDGDVDEYSTQIGLGDSADISITNSIAENGSNAGNFTISSSTLYTDTWAVSTSQSGLNAYPSQGDVFEGWIYKAASSSGVEDGIVFGKQNGVISGYVVRIYQGSQFDIIRLDDGSRNWLSSDNSVSFNDDEWYRIEVEWSNNGDILAKIYDSSGTEISSLSATDNTYTSGGFGWYYGAYEDIESTLLGDTARITGSVS